MDKEAESPANQTIDFNALGQMPRDEVWEHLATAAEHIRGGAFLSGLQKHASMNACRAFIGPVLGLALLAPEILRKPTASIVLVGECNAIAAEGGRWLTLFARVVEPACRLSITAFAPSPRKLSRIDAAKPLLLLPPSRIIRSPYSTYEKPLSADAIIIIGSPDTEDVATILSAPATVAAFASGTKVMYTGTSAMFAAIAAQNARICGYDTTASVEIPSFYYESAHISLWSNWICLSPADSKLPRADVDSIKTNIKNVCQTINSLSETLESAHKTLIDCFFGKTDCVRIQGADRAVIYITGDMLIDTDSGEYFEAESDGIFKSSGSTVPAHALRLLPKESPLDALALRFQQAVWITHVLLLEAGEDDVDESHSNDPNSSKRESGAKQNATQDRGHTFRKRGRFSLTQGITPVITASAEIGLPNAPPTETFENAKRVILDWFEEHRFGIDPTVESTTVEHPEGEIIVEAEGRSVWTARYDDRRQISVGAIWRTEVTILASPRPAVGVRVSQVRLRADAPRIEPAAPRVLITLATKIGLHSSGYVLHATPWVPTTPADIARLMNLLRNPDRAESIVIVGGHESGDEIHASVYKLATRLAGVAHVVVADADVTVALISEFGRSLAVWGHAARIYFPGFNSKADAFAYPLWTVSDAGISYEHANAIAEEVCVAGGQGPDAEERVPTFQTIRRHIINRRVQSAVLETQRGAATVEEDRDRLRIAVREQTAKILALTDEQSELSQEVHRLTAENVALLTERDSALDAERRAQYQVKILQAAGTKAPSPAVQTSESYPALPDSWDDLETWVATNTKGRVVLLPQATKAARASDFADIAFVYSVLYFLAEFYAPTKERDQDDAQTRERYETEKQRLGVDVCRVGRATTDHRYKDDYQRTYQRRKITMDLHVKRGAGFDPTSVFRLYFHYADGVVIVGHMPDHLTNRITHKG